MTVAPVICTIETVAPPARAFALFTTRMGEWWPGGTIGRAPHVAIVIEPHEGGRWYERDAAGVETEWGRVLVWAPPACLVLGWQIGAGLTYDPSLLTELELSFLPAEGGGTLVRLEHRNLERYGKDADRMAGLLGGGWPTKLAGFGPFASAQEQGGQP